MSAISDKHDILSDDNEETNNVQLEEEIHYIELKLSIVSLVL